MNPTNVISGADTRRRRRSTAEIASPWPRTYRLPARDERMGAARQPEAHGPVTALTVRAQRAQDPSLRVVKPRRAVGKA
jgi:hypothetical protein